jgi:hypothetical protein
MLFRKTGTISPEEEAEIRNNQIEIKRKQVIRLLSDFYTKILLNPQQRPHQPRPSGAGDIED